jgi:GTPase SAR1 family protein
MCFFGKSEKDRRLAKRGSRDNGRRTVKVVLCGNSYVGKTSITTRYKNGIFKEVHDPTIAATYQEKKLKAKTG